MDKEDKAYTIEEFVQEFDKSLNQINFIVDMIGMIKMKDHEKLLESILYLDRMKRKIMNSESFSELDDYLHLKKLYKRFDDENGKIDLFNRKKS